MPGGKHALSLFPLRSFPRLGPVPAGLPSMLWCALYLPDLALQVFTRGRSDSTPLAVLGPRPRQRVVAACPAAVACGVEPGLGRAGALALAPGLLLVDRDLRLEHTALVEIASWAARFTPSISLDTSAVLLEVEASLRLFGGLPPLCDAILGGLGELGFDGRLAVAPSPLAARWLARFAPGSLICEGSALEVSIDALPLAALADGGGLDDTTLELLSGVGAGSLGDVRRLPRSGLARRQARQAIDLLDRACGHTPDPRPWFAPPERHASRLPLPAPTDQVDSLLFALRRLLGGLSGWLEARHGGLEAFTLVLEHERNRHGAETRIEIILGALCRDMARCQLLAREHLSRLPLVAPVEALRLEADSPRLLAPPATDLFDHDNSRQADPGLLLATLKARLGDDAVRCLAVHSDHRPERAWRHHEPLQGPPSIPADRPAPPPRPLWLLALPRPIAQPAPEALLAGPERIESGWWDGDEADVCRDYFVARRSDHSLVWIFRERRAPHGWFLHGYFA